MFQKQQSHTKSDFRKDIPKYSDERIVEILKQRKHYRPEAAKLAIEEALKRGIIFSEQDLFSEKYKVDELNTSLFPKIKDTKTQNRIRKSIARSLVICGVLPMVFGLVQINAKNSLEGSLMLLFAVLWIYFSAQLIRGYNKLFFFSLLGGTFLSLAYVFTKLVLLPGFVFMDFFIPAVLIALLTYGLLFVKCISES